MKQKMMIILGCLMALLATSCNQQQQPSTDTQQHQQQENTFPAWHLQDLQTKRRARDHPLPTQNALMMMKPPKQSEFQ